MQNQYEISTYEGKMDLVEKYRSAVHINNGLCNKEFCARCGIEDNKRLLWWLNDQGIRVMEIKRKANRMESAPGHSANPTFIQF